MTQTQRDNRKKSFRIGASIKVIDRAGKESFYSVHMMRGDIALMNKNGSVAMTRVLRTDGDTQYFMINGVRYERGTI